MPRLKDRAPINRKPAWVWIAVAAGGVALGVVLVLVVSGDGDDEWKSRSNEICRQLLADLPRLDASNFDNFRLMARAANLTNRAASDLQAIVVPDAHEPTYEDLVNALAMMGEDEELNYGDASHMQQFLEAADSLGLDPCVEVAGDRTLFESGG